MSTPQIGSTKDELDTPALCLDLDKLESNMRTMAAMCAEAGVHWRPHSKAHKSPEIARREIEAGAIGVTFAKLGEAEVMAAGGIRDILIANQVVGEHKMRRLAELCGTADPIVAVDHAEQVLPMSRAVSAAGTRLRVLIEVDIGLKRAGTLPGEPTLRLADLIASQPGLELAGIMGYEGHLLTIEDPGQKESLIREAMAVLVQTAELLKEAGLPCGIVSAGGTGSFAITMRCPGVTELQAGGLIFMDAFYRGKCQISQFENALTVLTTVVSRPAPDRVIVDAGRKTHNVEVATPYVLGRNGIRYVRLSAEHGQFELGGADDVRIGDRLELVPGYSDLTTVLHDEFYGFRGGRLEVVWPLVGRGKLR